MKIADIRTHVLEAELDQPFSYSRAWYAKRASLIVEVVTDTCIVGWGESYGPAAINAAVIKHFRPFLIGQDPMRTEWIWKELYASYRDHGQKGSVIQGLSGVDIALWDIKGKFLNQPIHALLGGWQRKSVAAYATGLYRRESGDPVDYLAEEAMGYCAEGFGAVKLKVGFGIEADRKAVEAVRQAIGPDIGLMIDANHAYDTVSAISLGRKVEHLDIGWFEEPIPPEDIAGHIEVKRALTIPLAGGECEFTRYGFRDIMVRRAIDIVQPDICSAGGLSECKKIADMAGAFGIRFAPHVWGTGIAIAAGLHLLSVLPDLTPPSLAPQEPMLEFDRTAHPVRAELLVDRIEHENGWVAVPEGPGLGVEINRSVLERYRKAA